MEQFFAGMSTSSPGEKTSAATTPAPPTVPSDLQCPVCYELCIYPRIYPDCGHTVCSPCMAEMDNHVEPSSTFNMIIFKCPICRTPSFSHWNTRPINHHITSMIEAHPSYIDTANKKNMSKYTTIRFDSHTDTNLGLIASNAHANQTIRLYESILPHLVKAARLGQLRVEITDNVPSIQRCVRSLSTLLFKRNNIYRITCSRHECVVYLLPVLERYTNTFTNRDFQDANETTGEETGDAGTFSSSAADEIRQLILASSAPLPPPPPNSTGSLQPVPRTRQRRR